MPKESWTLTGVECEIARTFNLDSSDLIAHALEMTCQDLSWDADRVITQGDVDCLITTMEKNKSPQFACAVRMLRVVQERMDDWGAE